MTFFEAALVVLKSARQPLTVNEIVERAISKGLVVSTGKTPGATLSALLYRRIGRPDCPIQRLSEPGPGRARRGTVRWTIGPAGSPESE